MTRYRLLLAVLASVCLMEAASGGIFFRKKQPSATRLQELIGILKTDQNESKRAEAAAELGGYDGKAHPEIVPVLLEAVMRDPSGNVHLQAVESLGKIRPISQEAGQAIEYAMANDTSTRVRLQARATLLQYRLAGYRSASGEGPKLTPPPAAGKSEPPLADQAPERVTPPPVFPTPTAPAFAPSNPPPAFAPSAPPAPPMLVAPQPSSRFVPAPGGVRPYAPAAPSPAPVAAPTPGFTPLPQPPATQPTPGFTPLPQSPATQPTPGFTPLPQPPATQPTPGFTPLPQPPATQPTPGFTPLPQPPATQPTPGFTPLPQPPAAQPTPGFTPLPQPPAAQPTLVPAQPPVLEAPPAPAPPSDEGPSLNAPK